MWQMRWNLRGNLIALLTVAVVAACLTIASMIARRDKERIPSARRAVQALSRQAREQAERAGPRADATYSLELSQPGLELFPASASELDLNPSFLYSVQLPQTGNLPSGPTRGARLRPHPIGPWGFDWNAWLWDNRFPPGDLILNPEVLDSVQKLE
jgi:hypothetical protein